MVYASTKYHPFWWEAAEPRPGLSGLELPAEVDVLIVGSGYAACSAAMTLGQNGRKAVIVDAQRIGEGASSRSGGQVLSGFKRSAESLGKDIGNAAAEKVVHETEEAFDFFESRAASLEGEIDYRRSGAFIGAHCERAFRGLQSQATFQRDVRIVSRTDVREEIGTDVFVGGVVRGRGGQIHPAKYHRALAEAAEAGGAKLYSHARVVAVRRANDRFEVQLVVGSGANSKETEVLVVKANDVALATNGYTTNVVPWLAGRTVPVVSHMIATEPLKTEVMRELIPNLRVLSDTKRMLSYFRPCPQGERVLFGGRVSFKDTDLPHAARRLRQVMCTFFPGLKDVAITHAWLGHVAFAKDMLPHFGVTSEGIHYTGPYNGRGIALGTYLGHRMALRLLGQAQPGDSLDILSHQKIHPGYSGKPWFLPIVSAWYRTQDLLDAWRG